MLLFGKMLQFTHPHSTIPFPGCQPAPPEILRENDNTSMTEQYIIPVLKVFEGVSATVTFHRLFSRRAVPEP